MTGDPRTRRLAIDGGSPVRDSYLPFGRPDLGDREIEEVVAVLRSGWIGMGPRTLEFESRFAEYVGARHAVAVSSCTAGLHLALLAAGVGEGDEVVTTPMTFAATVNAILYTGATPVLADIEPETFNLEPSAVREAVSGRTRAVLPVNFGGLACDLDEFRELADEHHLVLVEDAAHAVGATHRGVRIGGHGHPAAFSFYPNKNMTSIEGGVVTTDDDDLAEEMRLLRLHGLSSHAWRRFESQEILVPEVQRLGYKYNFTDVHAALATVQLDRLEDFTSTRERYAALMDEELEGLPLDVQARPEPGTGDRHALHLYVGLLRLEELDATRDEIVRALRAENIGASVHYPAIHLHPYYRRILPYGPGDFPVAEWVARRTVTLPLSPSMDESDLRDVASAVRSVLLHYRRSGGE